MYPENETFIIPDHPSVCEDMKNYSITEKPMTGELGEISEWSARMALRDYPVGSEQSLEEANASWPNAQITPQSRPLLADWAAPRGSVTWGMTST